MQLILGRGEVTSPIFFQTMLINSKYINKFIDFFRKEGISGWTLKKKEQDIIVVIEAPEFLSYKLRDFDEYTYFTFSKGEILNFFKKLIEKSYKLQSIDFPLDYFEDEDLENDLNQSIYERNYEKIISILENNDVLIKEFQIKKDESTFIVYKTGSFYAKGEKNLAIEFLETFRESL